MKFNLLRATGLMGIALIGGKVLLWLVSPPPWALLPVPKKIIIRHLWKAAKMRQHIHLGMPDTRVAQVLGKPAYVEWEAEPGDIPNSIDEKETYYGQDGPLYVAYRQTTHGGHVVADVTTEDVRYYGLFD